MIAAAIICCLPGQPTASGQQLSSAFAGAIQYAQRRTVKIYGAAIGRVSGYATGILVSPDGRILTAQGIHLLADRIRVTLPDGTMHPAKVLRRDRRLQLALLKIDAETPDFFALADAPVVRQGDWILAVSNAFKVADGPEPLSVSLGIVSLRTRLEVRRGTQDVSYDGEVLLIDAITSNPGAAGGAVVTADHRLAGMIGKVIESTSTNTRINYAVPADLLAQFVAGRLAPPSGSDSPEAGKAVLGIRLFRLGGRKAPAYVDRVVPGSPAAKAGLRPDDLIVSMAGRPVRDVNACQRAMGTLKPNRQIVIIVKRAGRLLQIQLTPVAERAQ